jgi:hypothetical protein
MNSMVLAISLSLSAVGCHHGSGCGKAACRGMVRQSCYSGCYGGGCYGGGGYGGGYYGGGYYGGGGYGGGYAQGQAYNRPFGRVFGMFRRGGGYGYAPAAYNYGTPVATMPTYGTWSGAPATYSAPGTYTYGAPGTYNTPGMVNQGQVYQGQPVAPGTATTNAPAATTYSSAYGGATAPSPYPGTTPAQPGTGTTGIAPHNPGMIAPGTPSTTTPTPSPSLVPTTPAAPPAPTAPTIPGTRIP